MHLLEGTVPLKVGSKISFGLLIAATLLLALGVAGCRGEGVTAEPTSLPTSTVTEQPVEPTATIPPSPSPTSRERAESLATLQAQSTAEPCSAREVVNYANQVLPLANQHIEAADQARELQPWRQDMPEFKIGYIEATERLEQLQGVLAPACAEKAHLKFTSAFELLVDVWDHLGEGEFDIGQRKLISSFEEVSQAGELLADLENTTQP